MKIRHKRLILLLSIALIPVILASVFHRRTIFSAGSHLAEETRKSLIQHTESHLRTLVRDYGEIVNRDKAMVELALAWQAEEVERRLAAEAPEDFELFFTQDYDAGTRLPADMQLTDAYRRMVDGEEVRIPVSFDEQVFCLVEGVSGESVAPDLARLSTMPEVYRELRSSIPSAVTWLYTALDAGIHSSYPGHGGYPAEYDPRVREWYTAAREEGELVWTVMPDVSTRTVGLTASMAVKGAGGEFAGVTAIDVSIAGVLETLSLPAVWRGSATVLHVVPGVFEEVTSTRLLILFQEAYIEEGRQWRREVDWHYLDSSDAEEFEALRRDIAAGRDGVRRMPYKGEDMLWAYGKWQEGFSIPVVMVPYDVVIAEAVEAEEYVRATMFKALMAAGFIMVGVVCVVVVVAIISSRSITRPIGFLAKAARELSEGDYDAKVEIATGDELQELAEVFNDVGPKLREREKMKQSLALASEIQRHLLPQEAPQLRGFDIAGRSVPCDETGGDYYDFIEMVEVGEGKLGIALGDVAGHGIGAALLMASARSALRNQVSSSGAALDALLDKLNAYLVGDTGGVRFVTLFYGMLDAGTRTLRWASGGHDPAIWLRRKSGVFEELDDIGGLPLGIEQGATYEQGGPITLEEGDIVMVGTDGIWEAADSTGAAFGKERLRAVLAARADSRAEEICRAVVDAVVEFRGASPQDDDVTLVVIKAVTAGA